MPFLLWAAPFSLLATVVAVVLGRFTSALRRWQRLGVAGLVGVAGD